MLVSIYQIIRRHIWEKTVIFKIKKAAIINYKLINCWTKTCFQNKICRPTRIFDTAAQKLEHHKIISFL